MQSTFRPLRKETWVGEFTDPHARRSRYVFKANWNDTVNLLDREVALLGAEHFVIEADFSESDIRLDGLPRANARQPEFPGVRVAFESKHGPLVYQTDVCAFWQHNVRSIALGLEALRAVDRYGISGRAEQYTGFRAIEAPRVASTFNTVEAALAWLQSEDCAGFSGAGALNIRSLVKHAMNQHHPDRGGDPAKWTKVEQARQMLKSAGMI
jgi:hypothetical protein